jgi:hypothetical protein
MGDIAQEAALSASSVVRAANRLMRGVLRPLVENMSELAHSLVRPFVVPPLASIAVVRASYGGNGKSNAQHRHDEGHL